MKLEYLIFFCLCLYTLEKGPLQNIKSKTKMNTRCFLLVINFLEKDSFEIRHLYLVRFCFFEVYFGWFIVKQYYSQQTGKFASPSMFSGVRKCPVLLLTQSSSCMRCTSFCRTSSRTLQTSTKTRHDELARVISCCHRAVGPGSGSRLWKRKLDHGRVYSSWHV